MLDNPDSLPCSPRASGRDRRETQQIDAYRASFESLPSGLHRFRERFVPRVGRVGSQEWGAHAPRGTELYGLAGLPEALTRWVDVYLNDEPKLTRLEVVPYNDPTLEQFLRNQREIEDFSPAQPGDLFEAGGKAMTGLPADGRLLDNFLHAAATMRGRYERAYPAKNHQRGHAAFQQMIEGMWAARGDSPPPDRPWSPNPAPTPPAQPINLAAVRAWFEQHWDVDRMLTYVALINWTCVWDDSAHNYYLWQQGNGKWCLLPWDLDEVFGGWTNKVGSIYAGEQAHPGPFGPNFFKDSFIRAFRPEVTARVHRLNNTLLHPTNLATHGFTAITNFAQARFEDVNRQCASNGVRSLKALLPQRAAERAIEERRKVP
ncbi:MAG: CotH kinase family protein [Verrucomicrobiales bacterium]|nr:CotH kinase family protein [Verrucomicrobiales bacterium]